jgi:hypothetical protein
MVQVYLDNVKLNNRNKKWVDIDIRGRSLHTLELKEAVARIRIFSGHSCHHKRMNLTDSDICVFCNPNSVRNFENLSQCSSSIEKDNKQKISPAFTEKQEEKRREIQNFSH